MKRNEKEKRYLLKRCLGYLLPYKKELAAVFLTLAVSTATSFL